MADPSLAAWLRLTLAPEVGPKTQRDLLAAFGLPEAVFDAGFGAIARIAGDQVARHLFDTDTQAAIDAALVWHEQPGNALVTLADADYPRALLNTPDPPSLLYVKGNAALLNTPTIAIVGGRNATPQGIRDAETFAAYLAGQNITVVSGLALGIDGAAHRGALAVNGPTVAVVGTGADRIYPARHRELARAIAERGAVISEFPLGMPPLAHNFPRRNRLIAGLAAGCLVVEAALESGSLITARLAGELGRDVFAVPGSIHSPLSKGCHRLIKDGAKLVDDAADIMEELRWPHPAPTASGSVTATPDLFTAPATSTTEVPLLSALGHAPATLDELFVRLAEQDPNLTGEGVLAMLGTLELEGRIARLPGGRYQRLA